MQLYKKYRPAKLDEMFGNTALVKGIRQHFQQKNHNHAHLIYGDSGCGKTTLARAISREFLGADDLSITEINASTANGVDDMRIIEDAMRNLPIAGGCSIFIIDECQNLTPAAKSALLKPCEDMPEHVYFFFCTTNPTKFFKGDKGEKTSALTTRLTQWKVEPLDNRTAMNLLDFVMKREGIEIADDVFDKIIAVSEGSPRKLLVNLESVMAVTEIPDQLKLLDGASSVESDSPEAVEFCKAITNPSVSLNQLLKMIGAMKAGGKEEPVSLAKLVMSWVSGGMMKMGFSERGASILQNFDRHYDTNNIDYGWHVFVLSTIESVT